MDVAGNNLCQISSRNRKYHVPVNDRIRLYQMAFLENALHFPRIQKNCFRRKLWPSGTRATAARSKTGRGEAVWFAQNMLLGPRSSMDLIAQRCAVVRDPGAREYDERQM